MDECKTVLYVLHGYWNSEDSDGVRIVLVTDNREDAVEKMKEIIVTKAKDLVPFTHNMEVIFSGERMLEMQDRIMTGTYAKFYITEEKVEISDGLLEGLYLYQEKQHLVSEAKRTISTVYKNEDITKEEYDNANNIEIIERIIERYEKTKSCYIAFNDTMEAAVRNIIEEVNHEDN